mgnify:CR=1 FL=1
MTSHATNCVIDFMFWQIEANGLSYSAVARALNKQGIKGSSGSFHTLPSVLMGIQRGLLKPKL